jgi:protein O-mannosyl-transferase
MSGNEALIPPEGPLPSRRLRLHHWNIRRILLRPSLWVSFISIIAYWDTQALNGTFVYDDAGSLITNVVVNGKVPWTDVFIRDYWGTLMSLPQSHKSFRPITTLTFKLNWMYAERQLLLANPGAKPEPKDIKTFWFHIVNLLLHTIVTALVTEAAVVVFRPSSALAPMIAGLIFGLHPVHVEAVTNITSRGELLMSFFFLLAFLVYAHHLPQNDSTSAAKVRFSWNTTSAIYIFPWLFMTLSVFSKEQGATTLMALVVYDFIQHYDSVVDCLGRLLSAPWLCRSETSYSESIAFVRRAVVLTLQSAAIALWRYWLNGETQPDFVSDQNPAGFAKDRFTRTFSVSWIYCLYIWDALYPSRLGPDWSGQSIDLIDTWSDRRVLGVLVLWTVAVTFLLSLLFGIPRSSHGNETRRIGLMAFFAFLFCPFLLSSNLLVVVGLMKADRVIYLPLMGFALLEALLVKNLFFQPTATLDADSAKMQKKNPASAIENRSNRYRRTLGHVLILFQLTCFAAKLHERNVAWSHSLNLWTAAFLVNPRSHHTMYNCGYELSLKQRYAESEYVLRPIGSPRVDGPTNTFVYCMVLFNLHRCEEAQVLLDDAFLVVEEKRITGGPRNVESSLVRTKSNLLVAQAFCTSDIPKSAQYFFEAVKVDPTNDYAIEQANKMVQRLEQWKEMEKLRSKLGLPPP